MRYVLIGILAVGLVLRLLGVKFGLPLDVMGDEFVHVYTAFTLIDEMTLRAPSPLSYVPSLFAVLTIPFILGFGAFGMAAGLFDGIAGFKEFAILNATEFLMIGRMVSALFGTALVYVLYALARPVAGEKPALIAAALAAFDFWFVHESNKAHFWVPATALLALTMFFLVRVAETGQWRHYWSAVASAAAGVWMGFFPVILAPFLVRAHGWRSGRSLARLLSSAGALVAAIVIIAWLNPLSILKQFGRAIRSTLNVVGVDVFPQFAGSSDTATEPLQNALFLLRTLMWDNPFVFLLGLAGLVALVYRVRNRSFIAELMAGFFILYFLVALFIWPHPDHRYILPLLIPLLVGTAYSLSMIFEYVRANPMLRAVGAFASVALLGYSVYATGMYGALLLKPDTRVLAREWVFEHVPEGAAVYVDAQYFSLPKSKEAIAFYQQHLPEALRAQDRSAFVLPAEKFPRPAYFVIESRYAPLLGPMGKRYEYLVAGFTDPARRGAVPPGFERVAAFYSADPTKPLDDLLLGPNRLPIAVSRVSHLGPHIEIYARVE